MAISTGFEFDPHNTQPIRKADVLSPKEGMSLLDQFERMQKARGIPSLPRRMRIVEAAERRYREAMEKHPDRDPGLSRGLHRLQEIEEFQRGVGGPPLRALEGLPPLPKLDRLGVPLPDERLREFEKRRIRMRQREQFHNPVPQEKIRQDNNPLDPFRVPPREWESDPGYF